VKIKNERDFWSGVMFLAVGLAFVVFARNYEFGTAQRMGPAFFPSVLGGVLMVLGLIVGAKGLTVTGGGDGKVDKFHFGPLAWVLGAIVLYGVILLKAGLMLSMVVLILISMYGSHEFKWKEAAGVAVVMGAIVYGVFVYGLKLTIPVWPAVFGS
jgi:hypothetical protein